MNDLATLLAHGRPWTEAEYMALGETADRIELIDGALWISTNSNAHHFVMTRLVMSLQSAAKAAGLQAYPPINIRLGRDRIVGPDLAVVDDDDWTAEVTDAAHVTLIGEVTSASTATFDRVQKMRLYADAGIGWYLLAEPDLTDHRRVTVRLFRLDGDRYVEHAAAGHGETLAVDHPFAFEIRL